MLANKFDNYQFFFKVTTIIRNSYNKNKQDKFDTLILSALLRITFTFKG